jgi:tRNA(Ile)-lysidine synthase
MMSEDSRSVPGGAAVQAARHAAVQAAVQALPAQPLVLAVSGGADSMALLHAMARWAPDRIATVATFDHGTGDAARDAAALVVATARRLGVPVVRQRAVSPAHTEAEWREARWAFLDRVASAHRAAVATAHTADDQLETIVQRWVRGAGARGLAALAAPGPRVRPFLALDRATVRRWAAAEGVPVVHDPANRDRRHQRVRVRLDWLPVLEAADPGFRAGMLAVGEQAAVWRADVDALAWQQVAPGVWQLERGAIAGCSPEALAVLWPALLARAGVLLSAGGTARLVRFTIGAGSAGELQLDGGVTVVRTAAGWTVRSPSVSALVAAARCAAPESVIVGQPIAWPGWRIVPVRPDEVGDAEDRWVAALPTGRALIVRRWQEGDRISCRQAGAERRVSRYLAEMGVPRLDRRGWPVVLADGEIVWVPGVCRGLAAPSRPGRSDLVWYRSEREFR